MVTRFTFICSLLIILITAASCNKSPDSAYKPTGHFYYSAADKLMRFDFETKKEVNIFSGGYYYRLSPDAKKFAIYENNFSDGSTDVHIHETASPDNYEAISVSYILEGTPEFIPGRKWLGALVKASDDPDVRTDLLLFDYTGKTIGRIPHVKDFEFLPNGKDLVVSAEATNSEGEATGYALGLVKDFVSTTDQQTIIIHEFADYQQLPSDITFSPNASELALVHQNHLYTIPIKANAGLKQITSSRFRETDVSWSPDGRFLIFTANTIDIQDCGELRIVPARPDQPIAVPEDAYDNKPADRLQPVNDQGKVIHSCASQGIRWMS